MTTLCALVTILLLAPIGFPPEKTDEPEGKLVAVHSPSQASLRGVSVVNQDVVWVSGSEGTVLRSVDRGKSFVRLRVPDADELDFRDLHAFDADTCSLMVAGQPARFYHTEDGGRTWTLALEHPDKDAFFDAMEFWDDRHGIAFGDPLAGRLVIVTTDDGGRTWTPNQAANCPVVDGAEHGYAASGTCLTVGSSGRVWIGLGGLPAERPESGARVVYSADHGQTWKSSSTGLAGSASAGVFSLLFLDDRIGIAVGGDYLHPENNRSVLSLTRDGGETWVTPLDHQLRGYRSCVGQALVDRATLLIACGPEGCDVSADRGQSWRSLGDVGYHAIDFTRDGKFGWAVGSGGRIARWSVADED